MPGKRLKLFLAWGVLITALVYLIYELSLNEPTVKRFSTTQTWQAKFRDELVSKLENDRDLMAYNLDAASVTGCVVQKISESLPNSAENADQDNYFKAYNSFVMVKSPKEAEKAITDYRESFGSAKKAREAAMGLTDHIMTCMGAGIEESQTETARKQKKSNRH